MRGVTGGLCLPGGAERTLLLWALQPRAGPGAGAEAPGPRERPPGRRPVSPVVTLQLLGPWEHDWPVKTGLCPGPSLSFEAGHPGAPCLWGSSSLTWNKLPGPWSSHGPAAWGLGQCSVRERPCPPGLGHRVSVQLTAQERGAAARPRHSPACFCPALGATAVGCGHWWVGLLTPGRDPTGLGPPGRLWCPGGGFWASGPVPSGIFCTEEAPFGDRVCGTQEGDPAARDCHMHHSGRLLPTPVRWVWAANLMHFETVAHSVVMLHRKLHSS